MFRANSFEMKITRPQPRWGSGSVVAGQTHATQHVGIEQPQPVGIVYVKERLHLEDAGHC